RRAADLVLHWREYRRRWLPADDGPGQPRVRLHGQLLPLVRRTGVPLRLALLRPAGTDGQCLLHLSVDATSRPAGLRGDLAGALPRGAAAPGSEGQSARRGAL